MNMVHFIVTYKQFFAGAILVCLVWLSNIGKSLIDEAIKGHIKRFLKKDFIPEFIKKCLCIEETNCKKMYQRHYARRHRNKALYARRGGLKRNTIARNRNRNINKKIKDEGR